MAALVTNTEAILDNTYKLQNDIVASIRPEDATLANVLLPLATDENITYGLKECTISTAWHQM